MPYAPDRRMNRRFCCILNFMVQAFGSILASSMLKSFLDHLACFTSDLSIGSDDEQPPALAGMNSGEAYRETDASEKVVPYSSRAAFTP